MKQRCYNPNEINFKYYGGKGITVCDRWLESYKNFKEDMEQGYTNDMQIDRIDPDKGYCKDNCRWATRQQNQQNRSANLNKKSGSKYKGICKKKNRFQASIKYLGKSIFIGSFEKENDAALAYNKKAKELFGEFGYQNRLL